MIDCDGVHDGDISRVLLKLLAPTATEADRLVSVSVWRASASESEYISVTRTH